MKAHPRIFRKMPAAGTRSVVWSSWCRLHQDRSKHTSLLSWQFLRSVWSLLSKIAWRRGHRDAVPSHWGRATGCSAPRASAVYGRLN